MGDMDRVDELMDIFITPPMYGDPDGFPSNESPHNVASMLKRWLRGLPEPVIDDALGPALYTWCVLPTLPTANPFDPIQPPAPSELEPRIKAAQILLQLLPPQQFSIITYLLAFLSQLHLTVENRLELGAIAIIFGPALIASRSQGVLGLGPKSRGRDHFDPETVSEEVERSQRIMAWLIHYWPQIAHGIMACPLPEVLEAHKQPQEPDPADPRLLSPIDLRCTNSNNQSEDLYRYYTETSEYRSPILDRRTSCSTVAESIELSTPCLASNGIVADIPCLSPEQSPSLCALDDLIDLHTPLPPPKPVPRIGHGKRILSRAFSNMSISSLYHGALHSTPPANHATAAGKVQKVVKRSQSFTNLTNLPGKLKKSLSMTRIRNTAKIDPVSIRGESY